MGSTPPVSIDDHPILVEGFELHPGRTAMVIIDMQNFAAHPEYGWGPFLRERYPVIAAYYFPRLSAQVVPNVQRLIAFFRQHHQWIIYFTVGPHLPDGSDYLRLRNRATSAGHAPRLPALGTPEHEILSNLRPQDGELVLNKVSQGAFTSTGIDLILRNLGVDTLVMTGVHTNSCVETTARQAVDMGYRTVLVEDATAAFDQDSHAATLRTFRRLLGQVLSTDQVINQLSARMPG